MLTENKQNFTKAKKVRRKGRGNPNPDVSNLLPKEKIAPEGSAPLAVSVRIPASQYEPWMEFPAKERNEFLRSAIANFLKENGKLPK